MTIERQEDLLVGSAEEKEIRDFFEKNKQVASHHSFGELNLYRAAPVVEEDVPEKNEYFAMEQGYFFQNDVKRVFYSKEPLEPRNNAYQLVSKMQMTSIENKRVYTLKTHRIMNRDEFKKLMQLNSRSLSAQKFSFGSESKSKLGLGFLGLLVLLGFAGSFAKNVSDQMKAKAKEVGVDEEKKTES